MAVGAGQMLANSVLHVDRVSLDGEAARQKTLVLRRQHRIPHQVRMSRNPKDFVGRELVPAVWTCDLGTEVDSAGGKIIHA